MGKLNLGECALTFLGQICRTKKGYVLDDRRLHAEDAKFLISGGVMNVDDLQDLPKKGEKRSKKEGS